MGVGEGPRKGGVPLNILGVRLPRGLEQWGGRRIDSNTGGGERKDIGGDGLKRKPKTQVRREGKNKAAMEPVCKTKRD